MSTLVSVGNAHQSFYRLLKMVADCYDILPKPVIVQRGYTAFDHPEMAVVDFLRNDEFMMRLSASEVFISHAGAGNILSALSAGKRAIVCARDSSLGEHIDEQQAELATACESRNMVISIGDADSLRNVLESAEFSIEKPSNNELSSLVRDAFLQIEQG